LYATEALQLAIELNQPYFISSSSDLLAGAWKMKGNADSAFAYLSTAKRLRDSLSADQNQKLTKFQNLNFEAQTQLEKEAQNSIDAKNKIRIIALIFGIALLSILAFVFYRNNLQKQKANKVLQKTLTDLKSTQTLLIQSEKMASLGELTAGIAHEIQNPLNFVNNFSDVNTELIDELQEEVSNGNYEEIKTIANAIKENEQKINHHGKRAGDIVKGMLEHSRSSKGVKEPTDINALADEYLRLSYHGLRAKDKNFNAEIKTDFDESIGKINIIPQNIGRVFLNLFNNAFYAVNEQKIQNSISYNPTVSVKSEKCDGKVRITVRDNGKGIPQKIIDKIFQPFFTTKPTGEGTGLGLSLSYDIIKAHGGEIKVESKEGEGSEFVIQLPNV
jgi:signal transduction histidine kinase